MLMADRKTAILEFVALRTKQSTDYAASTVLDAGELLVVRVDFRPGEELRAYSPRSTYLCSALWSPDGLCELVWDRTLTMEDGWETAEHPDLRYGSGGYCEDTTAADLLAAWAAVAKDGRDVFDLA